MLSIQYVQLQIINVYKRYFKNLLFVYLYICIFYYLYICIFVYINNFIISKKNFKNVDISNRNNICIFVYLYMEMANIFTWKEGSYMIWLIKYKKRATNANS